MDLTDRVKQLEDAIRTHRDQKGDARCWLDDLELYSVLEDTVVPDVSLPPKEHFLSSCSRYWEHRQCPDDKTWNNSMPWPEWPSLLREAHEFVKTYQLHVGCTKIEKEKWSKLRDDLNNAVFELDKYCLVAEFIWGSAGIPFDVGDKVFGWRKNG